MYQIGLILTHRPKDTVDDPRPDLRAVICFFARQKFLDQLPKTDIQIVFLLLFLQKTLHIVQFQFFKQLVRQLICCLIDLIGLRRLIRLHLQKLFRFRCLHCDLLI